MGAGQAFIGRGGGRAIRYRILGPVEIRAGQEWQPVSAAKPRQLLAALLCRSAAVPSERLVDELWGSTPPATARQLLHGYVATLRKLLNDPQGITLVTRAAGYQLLVAEGELDSLRFLCLTETGRRQLREGANEAAADTFAEAIALWRGDTALLDVNATLSVQAERSRLDTALLTAYEGEFEAALACQRHTEILPQLERLVGLHPLREELRRQLMLALYRAGRQADALATYQDLRRQLIEGLGIEPSSVVQQVHQEILNGPTPSMPAAATSVTPRQLPPDTTPFVGRAAELKQLNDLLRAGGTAMVHGLGGVGKSALAIQAAHEFADHFPGGVLYADLRGSAAGSAPVDPLVVLTRFLRSLGVAAADIPDSVEETTALYRSLAAGRRLLQVLDNAADVTQLRPLLCSTATIITSRQVLPTLDSGTAIQLGELPESQAIELLSHLVGSDRVLAEQAAAADLVRYCGRLPLAVRIAGTRLAVRPAWPLRHLADRLANENHRLDELEAGDRAVRSSLEVSYSALALSERPDDLAAARLFRLLGLLDGTEVSPRLAAVLADRPVAEVSRSLDRLVDVHLLTAGTPDSFSLPDLVHLLARAIALREEPARSRRAVQERMTRWHKSTARPSADYPRALRTATEGRRIRREAAPRTASA